MAAALAVQDGLGMQTTSSDIGCEIEIRPLTGADREGIANAFSRLSELTRRRRFHGLASRLGERDLDRLTRIDHHRREALVAIAPGRARIVGVARYITLPRDPRAAEVAIVVDDEWQGRGIGRRPMSELVARARAEGITRLLAYVSTDNFRVIGWITRAGGAAEVRDGDTFVYGIALDCERRAAR
jgi:GNAT superfamily N-acetyltransferase